MPAELGGDRGNSRDSTVIVIDSGEDEPRGPALPVEPKPMSAKARPGSSQQHRAYAFSISDDEVEIISAPPARYGRGNIDRREAEGPRRAGPGQSRGTSLIPDRLRPAAEADETDSLEDLIFHILEEGNDDVEGVNAPVNEQPDSDHIPQPESYNFQQPDTDNVQHPDSDNIQKPARRERPAPESGNEIPPQPKRKRAKVKEKRGCVFRPFPSKQVLERMDRANTRENRLCLVDRADKDGIATFHVMGTNGNAYTCIVDLAPTCNCKDFMKRIRTTGEGPCKHLIFVFLRVLKMDKKDARWWQKRWLPSELEQLLAEEDKRPIDSAVMAEDAVVRRFRETQSQEDAPGRELSVDCPICFEEFCLESSNPQDAIMRCKSCKGGFHELCIGKWKSHGNASCPLCRASLPERSVDDNDEVPNFAQYSSMHSRPMQLQELYASTYQYIGRGGRHGIRRGGRGGRRR